MAKPSFFAICAVSVLALSLGACQHNRLTTGSINQKTYASAPIPGLTDPTAASQTQVAATERAYRRRPKSKTAALNYAQALRENSQDNEAVQILQSAALKHQNDREVQFAYGRALAATGRHREAHSIMQRVEPQSQADWRFLSSYGAVLDQIGHHKEAQDRYRRALALAPNEPRILSNLGLSYALTNQIQKGERVLREASRHPRANARVRQNLVLVLGLQGKFGEAEQIAAQDLGPQGAKQSVASLRQMMSEDNRWDSLKKNQG